MDLFGYDPAANLLPCDGEAYYHGPIFEGAYFGQLMRETEWRQDEAVIYGKRILTARKVAWCGDKRYRYRYSGTVKIAQPWSPGLSQLRDRVGAVLGAHFNSCLLNLYEDGSQGMAWHSDDETMLRRHGVIASVSFGAERRFLFKHKKSGEKVELMLEDGSLLVMKGTTQDHWLHSIPKMARVKGPRINLTFRQILE
ncbi:Alkylated DNA repair dioxygenase AlkB [Rubritalea squalenifaciens DSM 18772]|uniref:Alkylated DNA repair dioxygenase AlkB n=1 Tax=Rubritalea squalenifaciens DSM 18772 TaxID=1123071 RepID=A0A1M6I1W8_9BACT|nr:alpha-ketoglutarate-dependent dioxygenase AlkB [Rubritalea squalenifaciens]SHJ28428.1 Alkylated DNA repair dioxygenase AlkB [Rubritalea squalenifaciens DSM 18772]